MENSKENMHFYISKQALWSGKERRKQRARTSEETGRGWGRKKVEPTLGSLRSLIYFSAFSHCGACSQATHDAETIASLEALSLRSSFESKQ